MKNYIKPLLFFFVFTLALSGLVLRDYLNGPKEQNPYSVALSSLSNYKDLSGVPLGEMKGSSQIIIVNFWATWCTPCLIELPTLVELSRKYDSKKLRVIGINGDSPEDKSVIFKAVERFGINFTNIHDIDGGIVAAFQVKSLPFSIIFKDGAPVRVIEGSKDFASEEFLSEINQLMSM